MSLPTLPEAIAWIESRWAGQRPVPMRLHTRGTEGRFTVQGAESSRTYGNAGTERLGSPPFSPAFMAALTGSAAATMTVTVTTVDDTGVSERSVDRYRYPMTLALKRLSRMPNPSDEPHPYYVVVALAAYNWNIEMAARAFRIPDATILRAIRQLHSRYEEGPIGRPSWVDKSESQQRAEVSVA